MDIQTKIQVKIEDLTQQRQSFLELLPYTKTDKETIQTKKQIFECDIQIKVLRGVSI